MVSSQANETVRLEAFSDGVFAIDITLLTFQLRAPSLKSATSSHFLISTSSYVLAAGVSLLVPSLSILVSLAMVVYLSRLKYHREKVV